MQYPKIEFAHFIKRDNRFSAEVRFDDGRVETVHVKNTGRLKELLLPDAEVGLVPSENPLRKTRYDLVSVYHEKLQWVNIDSIAPNVCVKEFLPSVGAADIHPEFTYGDSRIDFRFQKGGLPWLLEIKGCTLYEDGHGLFPDAPTERGAKHLNELVKATQDGYQAAIGFVIAMNGVSEVRPNINKDPRFASALDAAVKAGVKIWYFCCDVKADSIVITCKVDAI